MPWSVELPEIASTADLQAKVNKFAGSEPRSKAGISDIAFALAQACATIEHLDARADARIAAAPEGQTAADMHRRFYVKLQGHTMEGGGIGDTITAQVVRTV